MDNIEQVINRIQDTLERHSERLLAVEGKLAKDYQSIMSLLDDVKQLKQASENNSEITQKLVKKVQELDETFTTFMTEMQKAEQDKALRDAGLKKQLSRQNKLLIFAIVLSSAALVYSTIQNGTTAGAVTTILSLLTKTWGL